MACTPPSPIVVGFAEASESSSTSAGRLEGGSSGAAKRTPLRSLLSELLALERSQSADLCNPEGGEGDSTDDGESDDEGQEGAEADTRCGQPGTLLRTSSAPIDIPCSEEMSMHKAKDNYRRLVQQRQLAQQLYAQQQQALQAQYAQQQALLAQQQQHQQALMQAQYAAQVAAAQQQQCGVPVH